MYGDIAAIEIYSHKSTRVPDVIKQGIMLTLCRKHGIKPDIDTEVENRIMCCVKQKGDGEETSRMVKIKKCVCMIRFYQKTVKIY